MTATMTELRAPTSTEQLEERLTQALNDGALGLMISIGHRTRLFDVLADLPPATSIDIARAAGLDDRYVREWLGAMTTSRLVEHDAVAGTYRLPAEHAALLTRGAGPTNLASSFQWLAVLGAAETRVVESFQKGGGLAYDEYPRFHEVMAEESDKTTLSALLESIIPLVPGADARLEAGIDVLDVGCGIGAALLRLAETYPDSRFTGIDGCADAVERAREGATRRGLRNVRFVDGDAAELEGRFDLITAFDAIHDQAKPDVVLSRIRRALAPGGAFLMQDIKAASGHAANLDHPMGTFVYTISCMHCMSVSLGQGGMGLGAAWGEQTARSMLAEAGFEQVSLHELDHDPLNFYFVCTV